MDDSAEQQRQLHMKTVRYWQSTPRQPEWFGADGKGAVGDGRLRYPCRSLYAAPADAGTGTVEDGKHEAYNR